MDHGVKPVQCKTLSPITGKANNLISPTLQISEKGRSDESRRPRNKNPFQELFLLAAVALRSAFAAVAKAAKTIKPSKTYKSKNKTGSSSRISAKNHSDQVQLKKSYKPPI